MRKFIVKHFALNYTVKMFGKLWSYPRAARITFPLFVLTGFVHVANPYWPTPTPFGWLLLALTTICFYIGFPKFPLWFGKGYFSLYPLKWEELDRKQKLQAGPKMNLTPEQYKEYLSIYNDYNK